MTDFRALCTELVEAWDSYSYADAGDVADRMAEAALAARAALAAAPEATAEESSVPAPAVPALPPGYIDPEHQGDAELPAGAITCHLPIESHPTPARLRHCPTHGQQPPEAWGCPECVRELRDELRAAMPMGLRAIEEDALARARATLAAWNALATAPKTGPSESDITELFYRHMGEGSEVGFENAIAEALARWGCQPAPLAEGESPAESLVARPLLEKVARLGDVIGHQTVAQVQQVAKQAAAWLQENPPGQPVAIEPRGCPMPGACSCVEPTALPLPAGEVQP